MGRFRSVSSAPTCFLDNNVTRVFVTVARVLGDFSPRASRPSGALAAKGDYCVRLSLKNVASQSSFSARREIPQTLRV